MGCCDSNSAQYERNRRFGHLVLSVGRATSAEKLPSVGLRLNASKSESRLVNATILFVPRACLGTRSPVLPGDQTFSARTLNVVVEVPPDVVRATHPFRERRGTKSSVDDLGTGRGVVISRAAFLLRSIETQP